VYYNRLEGEGQEETLGSPNVSVPRVSLPAGIAEPEEAHLDRVRGEMGTITLITDVVGFGVHICIRGKTRPTEGDFSDLFSLFSSLGHDL